MSLKIDNNVLIVGLLLVGLYLIYSTPKRDKDGFILGENSLSAKEINTVTADPNYPGLHYWIKYNYFPIKIANATIVIDTITIEEDLGNEIAPENKLIHTMDIRSPHGGGKAFTVAPPGADDSGGSMAEIMLTCEHDKDYFNTAFQGYSAHIFKMSPTVGHTYERKFMVDLKSNPRTIKYYLTDLTTGEQEHFDATLSSDTIVGDHLMASTRSIEYHDKFAKSGKPLLNKFKVNVTPMKYK